MKQDTADNTKAIADGWTLTSVVLKRMETICDGGGGYDEH